MRISKDEKIRAHRRILQMGLINPINHQKSSLDIQPATGSSNASALLTIIEACERIIQIVNAMYTIKNASETIQSKGLLAWIKGDGKSNEADKKEEKPRPKL